jgi:protein-tyrosine-phosphatase
LVGAFFTYNRDFALNKLELGRLQYHEDIDYTLQTLSMGYPVCQYLGILYEATTYKPRRHFIDRGVDVMVRDTELIKSYHPGVITDKVKYDPEEMNINIDVKWAAAYKPKKTVLFICHGNVNRSAAAELIARQKYPRVRFISAGVKADAGGELTSSKMRAALIRASYPGVPLRSTACSQKLINSADVVVYMDQPNLEKLRAFKISGKVLINMGELIGKKKIKDPAFSKAPEFDQCIKDIETALPILMQAVKKKAPIENKAISNGLFRTAVKKEKRKG